MLCGAALVPVDQHSSLWTKTRSWDLPLPLLLPAEHVPFCLFWTAAQGHDSTADIDRARDGQLPPDFRMLLSTGSDAGNPTNPLFGDEEAHSVVDR